MRQRTIVAFIALAASACQLTLVDETAKRFDAGAPPAAGDAGCDDECGGECVDLLTSDEHCGACDSPCGLGEECLDGTCEVSACDAMTECAGECVDLDTDPRHCGGCEAECAGGESCVGGTCDAASCGPGTIECVGCCADSDRDVEHCGGCGVSCSSNEVCRAGSCDAASDWDLRLADVPEPSGARVVQVQQGGSWLPICAVGIDSHTAELLCSHLGLALVAFSGVVDPGVSTFLDVDCAGFECWDGCPSSCFADTGSTCAGDEFLALQCERPCP